MDSNSLVLESLDEIDVIEYLSSRRYLSDLYRKVKARDEAFSYRKYAQALGFGATNYLHLLCTGQRPLSRKAAERIVAALSLSGKKAKYLVTLAEYESARKPIEREEKLAELTRLVQGSLTSSLSREELSYFSAWYHPVIREMVAMPDCVGDAKWIADHLYPRIAKNQVEESLRLLVAIGYIQFDAKEERYVQTTKHIRTPKEVKSLAAIRYHQEMINMGKESLSHVEAKRRDISAVTVMADAQLAEEIKVEIQKFRASILRRSEQVEKGKAIYQLNIQWFPFTKEDTSEK